MARHHVGRIAGLLVVLGLAGHGLGAAAAAPAPEASPSPAPATTSAPITLELDATAATRKIVHAHLSLHVDPGPLTLLYPKWIPGEHGPTGPIADLTGLKLVAAGKTLPWRRDSVNMYAIHCEIPPGAATLEIDLDYLSPAAAQGFSAGASASDRVAVVSWNQVVLYPDMPDPGGLTYSASLRIPHGWKYGTAMPVAQESGDRIEFAPVTLTTLIDSPVLIGSFFRTIDLTFPQGPPVAIDIAADSPAALVATPEWEKSVKRLVAEAEALFGAHHYRSYRFLLTLSDHVAHFGLEHHESSDDRLAERALIDPEPRELGAGLLSHEYFHSWNGKYRRPAGLASPDPMQPMKDDLLWVYEGLTSYYGHILAARSGLRTPEEYREALAADAADLDHRAGRVWRPLSDTAVAAQVLYGARPDGRQWRRGVDFYPEGDLIWLEADTLIRRRSGGTRSLDDFCRRFEGPPSGPPEVRPYTEDDVVAALTAVEPYDWRKFFDERLDSTGVHAPLGGIEAGGWRLVYSDVENSHLENVQEVHHTVEMSYSIGLKLEEDGGVVDVVPGMPAAGAGIGPGMKIVAVGGKRFTDKVLRDALKAAAGSPAPIDLLVENGDWFKTYAIDYHGGEKHPHLERIPGEPDLLGQILRPLAPPAGKK